MNTAPNIDFFFKKLLGIYSLERKKPVNKTGFTVQKDFHLRSTELLLSS